MAIVSVSTGTIKMRGMIQGYSEYIGGVDHVIPPKMNPEFKTSWLQALRSGKYQQGRGYLHTVEVSPDHCINYPDCDWCSHDTLTDAIEGTDRFCCLGVACDINGIKWVDIVDNEWDDYMILGIYAPEVDSHEFADITVISASLEKEWELNETVVRYLTYLNDSCGWSFDDIANWLEENV